MDHVNAVLITWRHCHSIPPQRTRDGPID